MLGSWVFPAICQVRLSGLVHRQVCQGGAAYGNREPSASQLAGFQFCADRGSSAFSLHEHSDSVGRQAGDGVVAVSRFAAQAT